MKVKVKFKDSIVITQDSNRKLEFLSNYLDEDESVLVNRMIDDYFRAVMESIHYLRNVES